MINRFLYVEDGSVDTDALQEELAEDTRVIVYRQGATPPILTELTVPARDFMESISEQRLKENRELRKFLIEIYRIAHVVKNTPKEIKNIVGKFYDKYGD